MSTFSLKILITRATYAAALSCYCAVVQAQLSNLPEFFEKHMHFEAMDAQDGPKLHTKFDFSADDTLITRSELKMNKDGFEDHMALGVMQSFDTAKAKVTYNLHRFNYSDREDQTDDVTFDIQYRSLRLQHRIEDNAQISTLGLPFDLFAVQLDLSFSQTSQKASAESMDVYSLASQVDRLKFSVTWKEIGDDNWADFSTEFRPSDSWLMKFTYTHNGVDLQRQFRSEYVARGYRFVGEYKSQTYDGEQTQVISAIGIEKDTALAALKLNLEYNDYIESPAFFLKVESNSVFD